MARPGAPVISVPPQGRVQDLVMDEPWGGGSRQASDSPTINLSPYPYPPGEGFSVGVTMPPRGHCVTSGKVCDCHD